MVEAERGLNDGTAVWVRAHVNDALVAPQSGGVPLRISGSFTHMQIPLAGLRSEGGCPLQEGSEVWVRGHADGMWTRPGTVPVRINGFLILHIARSDVRTAGDFGPACVANQDCPPVAPSQAA